MARDRSIVSWWSVSARERPQAVSAILRIWGKGLPENEANPKKQIQELDSDDGIWALDQAASEAMSAFGLFRYI